jgi:hypothetical protein
MDAKKNAAKEVVMQTAEEKPVVEAEIEDEFDEIEMQPMPRLDSDMDTQQMPDMMQGQDMPDMSEPCWHCPVTSMPIDEMDMTMEEEFPMEEATPVPLIPMDEMEDDIEVVEPMAMRGYHEDYNDFRYTNYNYRDYDDVDDILEKIVRYNPGIFRRLAFFGIRFPVSRNLVRRIIKLTLNYR